MWLLGMMGLQGYGKYRNSLSVRRSDFYLKQNQTSFNFS
jgi:hypothetical protein